MALASPAAAVAASAKRILVAGIVGTIVLYSTYLAAQPPISHSTFAGVGVWRESVAPASRDTSASIFYLCAIVQILEQQSQQLLFLRRDARTRDFFLRFVVFITRVVLCIGKCVLGTQ